MDLLENIKEIRKARGYTQNDMGDKLGIAPQNYNLLENGKTELTYSKMQKLAEVLDVPLAKLFGYDALPTDIPAPNEAQQREVARLQQELKEAREKVELLENATLPVPDEAQKNEVARLQQELKEALEKVELLENATPKSQDNTAVRAKVEEAILKAMYQNRAGYTTSLIEDVLGTVYRFPVFGEVLRAYGLFGSGQALSDDALLRAVVGRYEAFFVEYTLKASRFDLGLFDVMRQGWEELAEWRNRLIEECIEPLKEGMQAKRSLLEVYAYDYDIFMQDELRKFSLEEVLQSVKTKAKAFKTRLQQERAL